MRGLSQKKKGGIRTGKVGPWMAKNREIDGDLPSEGERTPSRKVVGVLGQCRTSMREGGDTATG